MPSSFHVTADLCILFQWHGRSYRLLVSAFHRRIMGLVLSSNDRLSVIEQRCKALFQMKGPERIVPVGFVMKAV